MIEQVKYNNYPLIESISSKRKQLELERIDVFLLKAQVGSLDPQISNKANRILRAKWDMNPELDANQSESIDINEQLAVFSHDELRVMFKNLVGIQLTEGCNGNCSFCMFDNKKGVTAKYSYNSLETLFREKFDMMTEHPFGLYWNSDPFDYRDGDHSFVDVYKLYREALPNQSYYISTAMPRGGEADFIKFMSYLASVQYAPEGIQFPIRLSLTQQNIQRVETTLEMLAIRLLEEGHSQADINNLFKHVPVARRFDNSILPIGGFIDRADDIRDTFSTACRDGIIIAPKSCHAIVMTAATIYEPSGQKNIELIPGKANDQIPLRVSDEQYAIPPTFGEKTLKYRTNERRAMLPIVRTANGEIYTLNRNKEDKCLKLGREVASLTRLIHNYSAVPKLELDPPISVTEKNDYLRICTEAFRERQVYVQSLVAEAEDSLRATSLLEKDMKEIKYYVLLTKVYLMKMDFLAEQFEQGKSINAISFMANALEQIGRSEIDKLPEIIRALSEIDIDKKTNEL
ncbi:MAG: hypothetical protein Q8P29_03120 [Candidatus Levybacteria bacterium]|nr:hypothetical protein [Candidatus Levybacteria bacterium]